MSLSDAVRVRFAPSPTGYVHIGSLRTALYNYLFAKKYGGTFAVRIEDTDQKRFVAGAVENLLHVLETMDILHEEGPFTVKQKGGGVDTKTVNSPNYPGIVEKGDYGPYIQSERLDIYREYAQKLISDGHAYYCFCTEDRLDAMREEQKQKKQMPKYDRLCLNLSKETIEKNLSEKIPHTIRFRVPDNETVTFTDLIRGEVSFPTHSMNDAVLMKSDGYPVYHLAVVVDDHLMRITHAIRAEEWLPSTPLHILIYRAFDWQAPEFAHLPLILNVDKSKLSKRQGDVAVEDYLNKGYLKEALINFVAFLGWNPGKGSTQELFSLSELTEQFDFSHVHKAGAVFDLKKLDWLNAQYIKQLPVEELYAKAMPFLSEKPFFHHASEDRRTQAYVMKVLTVEQDRLIRLDEAGERNQFFFVDTQYEKELLRWKHNSDEETRTALETSQKILTDVDEQHWTREHLSELLMAAAGEKRGDLLWPLRVALTGSKQSPSPFEVAWVFGKERSLARIEHALEKMKD